MNLAQLANALSKTPKEFGLIWHQLPVIPPLEGTINEVLDALPYFGRQPFAIASVNGDDIGINPFLDVVYKVPTHQAEKPIPVGVVSKNYRLVDHHQVLRALERTLSDCALSPDAFQVRAQWTINGERAHFSILFPPGRRFSMPLTSERDEMRFRVEIFNSVEGSYRLIAVQLFSIFMQVP